MKKAWNHGREIGLQLAQMKKAIIDGSRTTAIVAFSSFLMMVLHIVRRLKSNCVREFKRRFSL